jgi:hypothetical protein
MSQAMTSSHAAPNRSVHHGENRRRERLDRPHKLFERIAIGQRIDVRLGQFVHVVAGRPYFFVCRGAQNDGPRRILLEAIERREHLGDKRAA